MLYDDDKKKNREKKIKLKKNQDVTSFCFLFFYEIQKFRSVFKRKFHVPQHSSLIINCGSYPLIWYFHCSPGFALILSSLKICPVYVLPWSSGSIVQQPIFIYKIISIGILPHLIESFRTFQYFARFRKALQINMLYSNNNQ